MTGLQTAEQGHWHPQAATGTCRHEDGPGQSACPRVQLLGEGLLTSLFLGKRALPLVGQGCSGLFCHCCVSLDDLCQKCAAPNKRWDPPSAKVKKQIQAEALSWMVKPSR